MAGRTLCGRADLLFALDSSDGAAAAVARQLGLQYEQRHADANVLLLFGHASGGSVTSGSAQVIVSGTAAAPASPERYHFQRVVRVELSREQLAGNEPSTEPPAPPGYLIQPRARSAQSDPLCAWPLLWPRLEPLLGRMRETRELDLERVVDRLCRGLNLPELPFRTHRRLPRRMRIVLDRARALTPFWQDQELVYRALRRRLGRTRIERGPLLDGDWPALDSASRADALLVLSDLGALDAPSVQDAWKRFGIHLQHRDILALALVPLPAARISHELRRAFRVLSWEPRVSRASSNAPSAAALAAQARQLLALGSIAVRIEPGLLRAIRRSALPSANAGTEADAWADPAVDVRAAGAMVLAPEAAAQLRTELASVPQAQLEAALEAIIAYHAELRPEILAEEVTSAAAVAPGLADRAEVAWARRRLQWEAQQQLRLADGAEVPLSWFRRVSQRLPTALFEDPTLGAHLRRAAARAYRGRSRELPDGLVLRAADLPTPAPGDVRTYRVWQVGAGMYVLPSEERPGTQNSPRGTPLVRLTAGYPQLDLRGDSTEDAPPLAQLDLGLGQSHGELPSVHQYVLETDSARCVIERCEKPAWASAIGCDGEGLHASAGDDEEACCLRWTLVPTEEGLQGQWQPETLPRWAIVMGEDRFGLYAEFELNGVTQRMRWIPAGQFTMGTPQVRIDDEIEHNVELTSGFWLGDTACTQRLWQAVMGDNPSHFQGDELPVDSVSWQDCAEFFRRCDQIAPSLRLTFPTEAQWEYACRAGTRTAYSFGETITKPQVRYYDEQDNGPVPVKALPSNPWGLLQMHGNVWEWCSDWHGPYPHGHVTDPIGPDMGTHRVVRGGAWSDDARLARSAQRRHIVPGDRVIFVGFRVARGRTGRASQPQQAAGALGGGAPSALALE